MDMPDHNTVMCRDLVAGFNDAGVTRAFISPGSRNTPLTLAFTRFDGIDDISVRDERSAGFMALGAAKATGTPAVVVCTSGTAAAHYLPAIIEADQTSTPMIVLTADRPVGLRGTFAHQTTDQTHLYGSHVKAYIEMAAPLTDWRETARAIVATAHDGIGGPVHVNVPLSEPLLPDTLPPVSSNGDPPTQHARPDRPASIPSLGEELADKRVLIVAGGSCDAAFPQSLGEFAAVLAAPVIADPQCRPDHPTTVRTADMLARTGHLDRLRPDVVLRFGGLPTSKAVWEWLEACGVPQILVGRSRLTDPLDSAYLVLDVSVAEFVRRQPAFTAAGSYLAEWQVSDLVVGNAIEEALSTDAPTEPSAARAVTRFSPGDSALFVASSMPIRDVDTFGVARSDLRVIANRGVNGIDGSISAALGMALTGVPTTALIGDIAALHDVTALAEIARLGAPLRVIVINNDGGGIFSFLPQRRSDIVPGDIYEKHWGTPHGLSLTDVARSFRLDARRIATQDELEKAVAAPIRPELLEVVTDRDTNVEVHEAISDAVREALRSREY